MKLTIVGVRRQRNLSSETMPLQSGGGGGGECCGSGQTIGMEPIPDDSASDVFQVAEASPLQLETAPESIANITSVPCPRRRCPAVMSNGRQFNASGTIRFVFQQDNGDGP